MSLRGILCLTVGVAWLTATGCARQSVDLRGRACHDGDCARGYSCHPLTDACVPSLTVSCDGGDVCPSETTTGDACTVSGTFVPCVDGAVGCDQGCRTCRSDDRWGACEYPPGGCGNAGACATEETCVNGVCLRTCVHDADCPEGFHCPKNACVPIVPVCGDGIRGDDEDCDGLDLGGQDCLGLGFASGSLACTDLCAFDTVACEPITCGNLTLDPAEPCDGPLFGSHTCVTEGFARGALACTVDCQLDTATCVPLSCDDGVADPPEPCDGSDLGGHTCESVGLGPGSLSCVDCALVVTGCTGCGNGVKDGDEACDKADVGGLSCPGGLACGEGCELDFSGCTLASRGNGTDGALTVTAAVSLGQTASPSFEVTSIAASSVTVATGPTGLAAGDEVLLINVQGGASDCGSVGHYELLVVTSVSPGTVGFQTAVLGNYGVSGTNDNLTGQRVVLVRVPQFTTVQIQSGGKLTTDAWNGTTGGLLVMRVSELLDIDAGGQLSVDGLGYRPGLGISGDDQSTGRQGESVCGNPQTKSTSANTGGGGGGKASDPGGAFPDWAGQGGGGGGYGAPGTWKPFSNSCYDKGNDSPAANNGGAYGSPELATPFLGSGGGGGATDDNSDKSGTGGAGGGLILIFAAHAVIDGTVSARGGAGTAGSDTSDSGNGGGGSGGAIFLSAGVLEGTGALSAEGGLGLPSQEEWNNPGGDGGVGRIRIDYQTANGQRFDSPAARDFLAALANPDPGYSELYLR